MKLEIISKYPVESRHPTPLLSIHGTLCTASCWDVHFLDYFAQHGFASHAVNLVFAKVSLTLSLLPFVATPQLAGEALLSKDLPDEELLQYWKQMQDDSFMAFLDMVALDLPKPAKVKTPLLVLGVARDNMIAPSGVETTARAYNTRAEIIPNVAHNSMLDPHGQSVADRILAWLDEREVVNASAQVAEPADVSPLRR